MRRASNAVQRRENEINKKLSLDEDEKEKSFSRLELIFQREIHETTTKCTSLHITPRITIRLSINLSHFR
jgi:hypothetical protein